jgi:hypothetical protein
MGKRADSDDIDTFRDRKKLHDIVSDKSLDFSYMIKALVNQQRFGISVDLIGAAIEQAFQEASYVQIPSSVKEKDGTIEMRDGIIRLNGDRLMSGKEWLDCFIKGLDRFIGLNDYSRHSESLTEYFTRDMIEIIARRASGMEDK